MNNATSLPAADLFTDGAPREGLMLVDVRTAPEFAEAHLAGAVNLPLGDVGRRASELRAAAGEREIALVCRTGQRAERARAELSAAGFDRLAVVAGGMEACAAEGLPTLRGAKAMSIERQVRIAAGSLVVIGVTLGFLVHPAAFGLSAFVGAGLVFAGITDTCGMGMLLARMPWNRASDADLSAAATKRAA